MPTPELRQKVVAEERRWKQKWDAKHGESLECSERWAVYRGDGLLVDMK